MIFREVGRRCIVGWTMVGIYWDIVAARLSRALVLGLAGPARKMVAAGVCLSLAVATAWQGWYLLTLLFAGPVLFALVSRAHAVVSTRRRLRNIARKPHSFARAPGVQDTLLKTGVTRDAIARILLQAALKGEVVIAEFDQHNRVVSHAGHIPLYEGALIEPHDFRKRSRNRMQIVVTAGVVAVKKTYADATRFRNEVLALAALEGVDGVPKILAVGRRERVLYQSFLPGKNLGSLLAEKGASVSAQYLLGKHYPGYGNWLETEGTSSERATVLRALQKTVDQRFIALLEELFLSIHKAGVALNDVKHGNVLICDGRPHFCDFDLSHLFRGNGPRFVVRRELERDRLNYLFGSKLLTERSLKWKLRSLVEAQDQASYPPMYFGKGYAVRKISSIDVGSGKWLYLRRYLPNLNGRRILDLGSDHGVLALEMLRAGAAKVRTYEPDPLFASFAQLCHRFLEFVDNRTYDFELAQGHPSVVCDHEIAGYSMATAFDGLWPAPVETMKVVSAFLSERVEMFLVGCRESSGQFGAERSKPPAARTLQKVLAESGFARQRLIQLGDHSGSLIIAKSAQADE